MFSVSGLGGCDDGMCELQQLEQIARGCARFDLESRVAAQQLSDGRLIALLRARLSNRACEKSAQLVRLYDELPCGYARTARDRLKQRVIGSIHHTMAVFVQHVGRAMHEITRHAEKSSKVALGGLMEAAMEREISSLLASATQRAMFSSLVDCANVRSWFLERMDDLWSQAVLPVIAGELAAVTAEMAACEDVIEQLRMLQATVCKSKRNAVEVLVSTRKRLSERAHVLARIETCAWYGASRVPFGQLLSLFNPDSETALRATMDAATVHVAECVTAWLVQHLQPALTALRADRERLCLLHETPADSPIWHAVEFASAVDDPAAWTRLLEPGMLSHFDTASGRVYVRPCAPSFARVTTAARTLATVRALVSSGNLPLGVVGVVYADRILESDLADLNSKQADHSEQLLTMLSDAGCVATEETLYKYLLTLGLRVALPDAAEAGEASTSHAHDELRRVSSPLLAENAGDVLVAPTQRRRHVALRPGLVPINALQHYVVVFAIMRLVNDAVTVALRNSVMHVANVCDHAVRFSNDEILASTKSVVASVCTFDASAPTGGVRWQSQSTPSEVLALRRPFRSLWLLHEPDARLRQITGLVADRLCDAASGAQNAAALVGRGVPRFRAAYEAPRPHAQNVLFVAGHALEPACHAFLELCVRVCAHFEEDWPLPAGVVWTLPRMRDNARSARRHAGDAASGSGAGA